MHSNHAMSRPMIETRMVYRVLNRAIGHKRLFHMDGNNEAFERALTETSIPYSVERLAPHFVFRSPGGHGRRKTISDVPFSPLLNNKDPSACRYCVI